MIFSVSMVHSATHTHILYTVTPHSLPNIHIPSHSHTPPLLFTNAHRTTHTYTYSHSHHHRHHHHHHLTHSLSTSNTRPLPPYTHYTNPLSPTPILYHTTHIRTHILHTRTQTTHIHTLVPAGTPPLSPFTNKTIKVM